MVVLTRPSSLLRRSSPIATTALRQRPISRVVVQRRHRLVRRLVSSGHVDWSKVNSEAEFKGVLRAAEAKGVIPDSLRMLWENFYNDYRDSVLGSQVPGHDESYVARVQASIADRVLHQMQDPYTFPSYHTRILQPYNYYEFGQEYVGSLIDFENSFIGNLDTWKQISEQLQKGHNVVLLANHQTEADPGVFAHMMKTSYPKLAEDIIYVAGDRVITDPLCKPFSMGRNLFCVYSKRHIDDVPEERSAKEAVNRQTVRTMAKKLNEGGLLLWIAPSGGRDRPRADGVWAPNAFDPSSVGLMHALLSRAKNEGHLHVMAMVSWKMMPPPVQVQNTIGERRETNFTGVGISVTPEIDANDIWQQLSLDATKEERQTALAEYARDLCEKEFLKLTEVIENPSSRPKHPRYEQPWLKQKQTVATPR